MKSRKDLIRTYASVPLPRLNMRINVTKLDLYI
jgi:hypothetical protein